MKVLIVQRADEYVYNDIQIMILALLLQYFITQTRTVQTTDTTLNWLMSLFQEQYCAYK